MRIVLGLLSIVMIILGIGGCSLSKLTECTTVMHQVYESIGVLTGTIVVCSGILLFGITVVFEELLLQKKTLEKLNGNSIIHLSEQLESIDHKNNITCNASRIQIEELQKLNSQLTDFLNRLEK